MTALLLTLLLLLAPPATTTPTTAAARVASPTPWTEATIDPSGVAAAFTLGDFAYTRSVRKRADGPDRESDVLIFTARAKRAATHAAIEVRFLDDQQQVLFAGLARFDPLVLQWTIDKTATGTVVIDPELMPKVKRIVFAPI